MSRRWRALSCAAVLVVGPAMFTSQAQDQHWQALDTRVTELYRQGDLQAAITVAQSALEIAASPHESGRSLDRLGFLYYTSGDLTDGEKYLRQSLQIRESSFGADS